MSNIEQYLADILAARYGEEVRQSIHDAIEQCYEDGRAGAIDLEAREDIAAETTAREALDTRVEALENDTTTAEEVTYDDTDTQLGATDVQGAIGALNNNLANCWKIGKISVTEENVTIESLDTHTFVVAVPPGVSNAVILRTRSADATRTLIPINGYVSGENFRVMMSNQRATAFKNETMTIDIIYAYT